MKAILLSNCNGFLNLEDETNFSDEVLEAYLHCLATTICGAVIMTREHWEAFGQHILNSKHRVIIILDRALTNEVSEPNMFITNSIERVLDYIEDGLHALDVTLIGNDLDTFKYCTRFIDVVRDCYVANEKSLNVHDESLSGVLTPQAYHKVYYDDFVINYKGIRK